MSQMSNKTLHPFFQQQKKKSSVTKAAKDSSRSPSPKSTRDGINKASPPKTCSNGPNSRSDHDSHRHVNKGEGSKPRQMSFPTFYAEIYEQEATFDHFGQPYSNKPKKAQDDHEFSRLNVLDSSHVTDKVFEPWKPLITRRLPPTCQPLPALPPIPRRCRRQPIKPKGDQSMLPTIHTQAQLEHYLDIHFPLWHRYASCKELCQTMFCIKKQSNDHRPWTEKYRPHTVKSLIGDRHHYAYLKDWLHQMEIAPISASKPNDTTTKKKKKKKVVVKPNLDHSDEEEFIHNLSLYDHHDEKDDDFVVNTKKKIIKSANSMRSNVLLIWGDHGIGKTASVYTAAEELGYEVFEINAGSKRSGKDVMALVGEMTKSHLVTFATTSPTAATTTTTTTTPNGKKKKKLNPYFAPTQSSYSMMNNTTISKKEPGLLKHFAKTKKPTLPPLSSTKQSLILLEEVDLLFEEDKGFWPSVIELSQKSKRPIIMTCNDPDQIPFENLCLQKVLDLKPPNEQELLPYLWLVCFAEGFMMHPADLMCLMVLLGRDIRQLLQTLSLYAGQEAFGKYLGFTKDMDPLEMKEKCIPSSAAIDTYRLASCYLDNDSNTKDGDEQEDELENIVQALENNAFADTWLGWKEKGNQVHESTEDQIIGYTGLLIEEIQDNLDLVELEPMISVLNGQILTSPIWTRLITEASSHYEELNDARIHTFDNYKEAIEKLLPISYVYHPYTEILTSEYIPHIQTMLYYDNQNKSKTRSKRRKLYLPLNEEAINHLTTQEHIVDETKYWTNQLEKLKKE